MLIYGQIEQVREAEKAWKKEGKSFGFVTTMGYIHEINAGTFPGPEHTYKIDDEVIEKLY